MLYDDIDLRSWQKYCHENTPDICYLTDEAIPTFQMHDGKMLVCS
jgi:hypothetical protein